MTIEQLLECSADELEKMSDAELLKHFDFCLHITRPEQAVKEPKRKAGVSFNKTKELDNKLSAAALKLKQLGIDLEL